MKPDELNAEGQRIGIGFSGAAMLVMGGIVGVGTLAGREPDFLRLLLAIVAQVNAQTPRFHNPKRAGYHMLLGPCQEIAQSVSDGLYGRARSWVEDNDAGALLRWKSQGLSEIAVERYQNAIFVRADIEESFIAATLKSLVANGHDVMPRNYENLDAAATNIFVELEFH